MKIQRSGVKENNTVHIIIDILYDTYAARKGHDGINSGVDIDLLNE